MTWTIADPREDFPDAKGWLRIVDSHGLEMFRLWEGSPDGIGWDRGARARAERIIAAVEHHAIYEPVPAAAFGRDAT